MGMRQDGVWRIWVSLDWTQICQALPLPYPNCVDPNPAGARDPWLPPIPKWTWPTSMFLYLLNHTWRTREQLREDLLIRTTSYTGTWGVRIHGLLEGKLTGLKDSRPTRDLLSESLIAVRERRGCCGEWGHGPWGTWLLSYVSKWTREPQSMLRCVLWVPLAGCYQHFRLSAEHAGTNLHSCTGFNWLWGAGVPQALRRTVDTPEVVISRPQQKCSWHSLSDSNKSPTFVQ